MGLFSSKKVTTVGTTVTRVILDKDLPNSIKTGGMKALLDNGDSLDYVREELFGSVAFRAERMYSYAKRAYTYGLPSGQVLLASQGQDEVQEILEALEGTTVFINYSLFGPANNHHMGWMELFKQQGYDSVTNRLGVMSAQVGQDVYLKMMQVVIPKSVYDVLDPAALQQWGTSSAAALINANLSDSVSVVNMVPQTTVVVSTTALKTHIRITGEWADPRWKALSSIRFGGGSVPTLTRVTHIDLPTYDEDADYFHVKYTVNGRVKYWMYEAESGGYPILDALVDKPPTATGTFFPFVYFRFGKKAMGADKNAPEYKTSKKMTKYLGMDYQDMIDAIHENPDIKDVEQAMMIMAVSANSTDGMDARYLFDFFSQQYLVRQVLGRGVSSGSFVLQNIANIFKGGLSTDANALVIRDKRFRLSLSMGGISRKLVAGKIGKVGIYSSLFRVDTESYEYIDNETGNTETGFNSIKVHVYRHQRTASIYEQVEVRGLKMTYHIYGRHNKIGEGTDAILLIPLDHSISRTYSMKDREVLYSRGMQFVFNSRVVTKVKWYQTGFFQFLLIVVMVIITIWSGGGAAGIAASITAATATVTAFIWFILKAIIIQIVVKLFVKLVGAEFALLVAIVAAAYGIYLGMEHGSIAGAPWASRLLQLSSGISSGVNNLLKDDMNDLLKQNEKFGQYAEDKMEALDKVQDLLDGTNHLSPFVIFGESPDDFYNRTVHSGNIGVTGIDAITNYVDIALTLPDFNKTLGDDYNAI